MNDAEKIVVLKRHLALWQKIANHARMLSADHRCKGVGICIWCAWQQGYDEAVLFTPQEVKEC